MTLRDRIKPARASLELDVTMSHRQIADALGAMVFTAARDWTRTVRMDEAVRDLIVKTLRLSYVPPRLSDPCPQPDIAGWTRQQCFDAKRCGCAEGVVLGYCPTSRAHGETTKAEQEVKR